MTQVSTGTLNVFFFFFSCFYHISGTDETCIEAKTPSEGECTDMKENVLSEPTAGVGGRELEMSDIQTEVAT